MAAPSRDFSAFMSVQAPPPVRDAATDNRLKAKDVIQEASDFGSSKDVINAMFAFKDAAGAVLASLPEVPKNWPAEPQPGETMWELLYRRLGLVEAVVLAMPESPFKEAQLNRIEAAKEAYELTIAQPSVIDMA
jgi:hypothetical protein